MKTQTLLDRGGKPITRQIIETREDRLEHINQCRAADRKSRWGEVKNPQHYANLGDIAAVNCWRRHNSITGFEEFYANTPEWIVEIAREHRWITTVGKEMLT
jgi:hypothetical protein